jgi:hypothetical protein
MSRSELTQSATDALPTPLRDTVYWDATDARDRSPLQSCIKP